MSHKLKIKLLSCNLTDQIQILFITIVIATIIIYTNKYKTIMIRFVSFKNPTNNSIPMKYCFRNVLHKGIRIANTPDKIISI